MLILPLQRHALTAFVHQQAGRLTCGPPRQLVGALRIIGASEAAAQIQRLHRFFGHRAVGGFLMRRDVQQCQIAFNRRALRQITGVTHFRHRRSKAERTA